MKKEKLVNIITEIYHDMYHELGVNFEDINKEKMDWFLDYSLPREKQDEIIDNKLKEYRVDKLNKQIIKNSVVLGVSPRY